MLSPVKVTLSIGVCSAIQNNVNSNDIMRDVDEALYEAKHTVKTESLSDRLNAAEVTGWG